MTAPVIHNEIIEPPRTEHYEDTDSYRHHYAMWKRSGGLLPAVVNLRGLLASVAELNTLVGINKETTVQTQLDSKANVADLGTMAAQNANNVAITGGTISGVTVSDSAITLPAGNSSDIVQLGGNLYTDYAQHSNSLAAETVLGNKTILANSLVTDGEYIEVYGWGTYANNINNKTIKLIFGTTVLYNTGTLTAKAGSWKIKAFIMRAGSSSEKVITEIISSSTIVQDECESITASENLGTDLKVAFTGTGVADDDILQEGMIIRWFKA